MHALPMLVVELPVPAAGDAEWSQWYHQEHIPDVLRSVDGVLRSRRYRLIGGQDEFRYLVTHEFSSVGKLRAYQDSIQVENRWGDYERLWGLPAAYRRRSFEPIFERER